MLRHINRVMLKRLRDAVTSTVRRPGDSGASLRLIGNPKVEAYCTRVVAGTVVATVGGICGEVAVEGQTATAFISVFFAALESFA